MGRLDFFFKKGGGALVFFTKTPFFTGGGFWRGGNFAHFRGWGGGGTRKKQFFLRFQIFLAGSCSFFSKGEKGDPKVFSKEFIFFFFFFKGFWGRNFLNPQKRIFFLSLIFFWCFFQLFGDYQNFLKEKSYFGFGGGGAPNCVFKKRMGRAG